MKGSLFVLLTMRLGAVKLASSDSSTETLEPIVSRGLKTAIKKVKRRYTLWSASVVSHIRKAGIYGAGKAEFQELQTIRQRPVPGQLLFSIDFSY